MCVMSANSEFAQMETPKNSNISATYCGFLVNAYGPAFTKRCFTPEVLVAPSVEIPHAKSEAPSKAIGTPRNRRFQLVHEPLFQSTTTSARLLPKMK